MVAVAKQRLVDHVTCKTLHGLAFGQMNKRFADTERMLHSPNVNLLLDHISINDLVVAGKRLSSLQIGNLVLSTLRTFFASSSTNISETPVPMLGVFGSFDDHSRAKIAEAVRYFAIKAWKAMIDTNGTIPIGHDGYFKLWTLGNPELNFDYILFDEAQDASEVMLELLSRQPCPTVYVGDPYQQIYEWRGAVNSLERVHTHSTCHLTQSFRFGESIAEVANIFLRLMGERRQVSGNCRVRSVLQTTNPSAIICRTNAAAIAELMQLQRNGIKAKVDGANDLLRLLRGIRKLKRNKECDIPEFFGFKSWFEVVEYSRQQIGNHLRPLVSLVDSVGLSPLHQALKESTSRMTVTV